MILPIRAAETEDGDVILRFRQHVTVKRRGHAVWIRPIAGGEISVPSDELLHVVSRAYPRGETEDTMRLHVFRECQQVLVVEDEAGASVDEAIDRLLDAIVAFKLGKS